MVNFWRPWKKIARLPSLGKKARFLNYGANRFAYADGPSHLSRASGASAWDFEVEDDLLVLKELFGRFSQAVTEKLSQAAPRRPGGDLPFRIEKGKLPYGRSYLYLQPWNRDGWLIEEEFRGWRISAATKIVHEGRFLRSHESWEAVCLLRPKWRTGLIRISSQRLGDEPLSYPIYEDMILSEFKRMVFQESDH